jgi:hypothetical protein
MNLSELATYLLYPLHYNRSDGRQAVRVPTPTGDRATHQLATKLDKNPLVKEDTDATQLEDTNCEGKENTPPLKSQYPITHLHTGASKSQAWIKVKKKSRTR